VATPTLERITEEPESLPEPAPSAQAAVGPQYGQSTPQELGLAPIQIAEVAAREASRDTADAEEAALLASQTVQPGPESERAAIEQALGGVVLLLGQPQRVLPSGRCYLAVRRSDGSTSVSDNQVIRNAAGAMQAVRLSNVSMLADYRLPEEED
jgi:hypothetical protein